MSTHSTSAQVSRVDKERARKRAKRAGESQEEIDSRWKKIKMQCRASESEVERAERLAANQQREAIAELLSQMLNMHCVLADRRASESDGECVQHLVASQQREANRRGFESEAEHTHQLAAGQQREANRRAAESNAQREYRLCGN